MKRKWLSRTLATALTAVMMVGTLVGCGGEQTATDSSEKESQVVSSETQSTTVSEPVVDEGVTYPVESDVELTFHIAYDLLKKTDRYAEHNEVPFYKGLSEKTGIDVTWTAPVSGSDQFAAYNLYLQEEELADIMHVSFKNSSAEQLFDDGLIYDLTEYLPKYAPDFWAYYNDPANDAEKRAIVTGDGKFLFMPTVNESDLAVTYTGPVIRQDWLDECGLTAPVTLEDWTNVLRTFKEKYNAYLCIPSNRFPAVGVASGTDAFAGLKEGFYVEDGVVKCGNVETEWKEMLAVLNAWYEEGLIDPDFTTAKDADVRTKVLNNQTGIVVTALSQLTNFIADAEKEGTGANWVGFGYPRTAAGAATKFIQTSATKVGRTDAGCVVTTSATEEELIEALKFLNYGYTEEGAIYWNFGEEGVSYEVAADGSFVFTDLVAKDERGINTALYDYTGVYATGGPSIVLDAFTIAKNNPTTIAAISAWVENSVASEYVLPPYTRTADEQARYADLSAPIKTYISEMAIKFVTGEESLDAFDKFVETLNGYDLAELLEIEQAAYDRYMAK